MLNDKNEIKSWLDKHNVRNYIINEDLTVDVNETVVLKKLLDIELPVQFGNIEGSFLCMDGELTTLKGFPKKINGDFSCKKNKISNLDYFPELITKSISIGDNNISDIKKKTKTINGDLTIENNKIREFSPNTKLILGELQANSNLIESLINMPKVSGSIFISKNKIKSLLGVQEVVNGSFDVYKNNLKSLKHGPKYVTDDYYCFSNKLTSLKHSPKAIKGNFYCFYNAFKNLKGSPEKVNEFECGGKNLQSLEGGPKYVKNFITRECPSVTNAKGLEITVENILDLSGTRLNTLEINIISAKFIKIKYKELIEIYDLNKDSIMKKEDADCMLLSLFEINAHALSKKITEDIPINKINNKKIKI